MKPWRLPVVVALLAGEPATVLAQMVLPDVVVETSAQDTARGATSVAARSPPAPGGPAASAIPATPTPQTRIDALDQSRDSFLLPKLGASSYTLDRAAIDALPRGDNTPLDKVILQAPGVAQDLR